MEKRNFAVTKIYKFFLPFLLFFKNKDFKKLYSRMIKFFSVNQACSISHNVLISILLSV